MEVLGQQEANKKHIGLTTNAIQLLLERIRRMITTDTQEVPVQENTTYRRTTYKNY